MAKEDERSALVALTEAQIRALLYLIERWQWTSHQNVPPSLHVHKAEDQLKIALFAIQQEN